MEFTNKSTGGVMVTSHAIPGRNPWPSVIGYEITPGGAPSFYLVQNPQNKLQELVLPFQHKANQFGLTNEVLLAVVMDRLQRFQAGEFPSDYNKNALDNLELAMHWLQKRTIDRAARGVEGKHEA